MLVFFLCKQGARLGVVMVMPKGLNELLHPELTEGNGAALCFSRSNVMTLCIQFSSPFLSSSSSLPTLSSHMIMWLWSLPKFYSWTSLTWISSSQQRETFPCDFVWVNNSEQDTCRVWRSKSNSCSITAFQATRFFSTGIFSIKLVCLGFSSHLLQWLLTELKRFPVTEGKKLFIWEILGYWVLLAKTWKTQQQFAPLLCLSITKFILLRLPALLVISTRRH